ncbi:unnamed protein product [Lactuca saligna]|uniref:Uncharacterized protein n=1 Tax=Lactuca saligna TaxID=75948 RepID=A0AA35YWL5_LACSI|nr:unnamed protein product [Lactuca saligna]
MTFWENFFVGVGLDKPNEWGFDTTQVDNILKKLKVQATQTKHDEQDDDEETGLPKDNSEKTTRPQGRIHQEQEKHKQFLGFLVPYYKPAEYISLLVTYAGNNLVERTYESDINGNKFNTRVHAIRC